MKDRPRYLWCTWQAVVFCLLDKAGVSRAEATHHKIKDKNSSSQNIDSLLQVSTVFAMWKSGCGACSLDVTFSGGTMNWLCFGSLPVQTSSHLTGL